jgi:hypothetical protein
MRSGQYAIVIVGSGPNGNDAVTDADAIARQAVIALHGEGHRIFDARFVAVAGEGRVVDLLEDHGEPGPG